MSYVKSNSDVYCTALDLSKAFDKVNIEVLVNKLKFTDLPGSLVNIIKFILFNTCVKTSFHGVTGNDWVIGNVLRQGGIFHLYCSILICIA